MSDDASTAGSQVDPLNVGDLPPSVLAAEEPNRRAASRDSWIALGYWQSAHDVKCPAIPGPQNCGRSLGTVEPTLDIPRCVIADRDEVSAWLRQVADHPWGRSWPHVLDRTRHRRRSTTENQIPAVHHGACSIMYRDGQLSCRAHRAAVKLDSPDCLRCGVGGGQATYHKQPFTRCEYGRARHRFRKCERCHRGPDCNHLRTTR